MPENKKIRQKQKAWVVAADMGYGHMRTAYPLRDIAFQTRWFAPTLSGNPQKDSNFWKETRSLYEFIQGSSGFPCWEIFCFPFWTGSRKLWLIIPSATCPTRFFLKNIFILYGADGQRFNWKIPRKIPALVSTFSRRFMAESFAIQRIYSSSATRHSRAWFLWTEKSR